MEAKAKSDTNKLGAWMGAGGILGAVAASSCCILPLALFTLGAGGAWMSNLRALEPYQPIFIAITVGFLAAGFYFVYRRPSAASGGALRKGATCRPRVSRRGLKIALWTATVLVAAAAAFPYVAPSLLGA